jgi:hypothetical protein
MNIKDLQDINGETVVSLFKVSTLTRKEVILAELKKNLIKAQWLAQEKSGDMIKYDFSMEPDEAIGEMLLALNLRVQNAKLHSQEVSIFNKLSNRMQMACKSWHLEVACRHVTGSDFVVLGHLWSQNDVIMSWLRLTATSTTSHIQIRHVQSD